MEQSDICFGTIGINVAKLPIHSKLFLSFQIGFDFVLSVSHGGEEETQASSHQCTSTIPVTSRTHSNTTTTECLWDGTLTRLPPAPTTPLQPSMYFAIGAGFKKLPSLDFGPQPIHTLSFEENGLTNIHTGDFFGLKVDRLLLGNNSLTELDLLSFWGLEYQLDIAGFELQSTK